MKEFLDSLSAKQSDRVSWVFNVVKTQEHVPSQFFQKLVGTEDIWEIRVQASSDIFRFLGFWDGGRQPPTETGFVGASGMRVVYNSIPMNLYIPSYLVPTLRVGTRKREKSYFILVGTRNPASGIYSVSEPTE